MDTKSIIFRFSISESLALSPKTPSNVIPDKGSVFIKFIIFLWNYSQPSHLPEKALLK